MDNFKKIPLLLAGLTLLAACAAAPQADSQSAPRRTWAVTVSAGGETAGPKVRYTREDYRFLESLHTEDYRDKPLTDFNAALADWNSEDAFHKTEDALQRLCAALPEDDPLRAFLDGTVDASWNECRRRHYSACDRSRSPSAGGELSWERQADVFGDLVTTAWAWGSFWYTYEPAPAVTVGERDDFLQGVAGGMQAYLTSCPEDQRAAEQTMEKSLLAELKRLTAQDSTRFAVKDWEVSYQWEQVYD